MRLSARPLIDVANVNVFRPATVWQFTESDASYLYFQLIDESLDTAAEGFNPPGRRYCPVSGATLSVTFTSVDVLKELARSATQPFTEDKSIWRVQTLSTDILRGSLTMQLTLTEASGNIIRGILQPAACVRSRYLTR